MLEVTTVHVKPRLSFDDPSIVAGKQAVGHESENQVADGNVKYGEELIDVPYGL